MCDRAFSRLSGYVTVIEDLVDLAAIVTIVTTVTKMTKVTVAEIVTIVEIVAIATTRAKLRRRQFQTENTTDDIFE